MPPSFVSAGGYPCHAVGKHGTAMTKLFIITATIIGLSSLAAKAEDCAPQPYRLQVVIDAPRETVDRTLDSEALGRMLTAKSLPGYVTQGLTQVDYVASYSTEYESQQLGDGKWCSRVGKITVKFGFAARPKIYISSALPVGSCVYNEVMKHEYQHLKIAQDTLSSGRKLLAGGVKEALASGGVIGSSPEAANAQIDRAISKAINRITGGLYAAAKLKNMALDTPQNYARLGKICRR